MKSADEDAARDRPLRRWRDLLLRLDAPRPVGAVVLLGLLVMVILVLVCGYVPQTTHPWSSATLLDGGWRLLHGQHPHQDFHSPVGFIYLGLVGLAMALTGPGPDALAWAPLLLLPLLAPLAWWVALRRLRPALAGCFVLWVAAHLLSPAIFGTIGNDGLSYAGQYARLSWAVFMVAALLALLPAREGTAAVRHLEAVAAGTLLGLLFGMKITYAIVTVGMLIAGQVLAVRERSPGLRPVAQGVGGVLIGAVAVIAGFLLYTGADLAGYLRDLAMVPGGSTLTLLLRQVVDLDLVGFAILLTCGILLVGRARALPPGEVGSFRGLVLGLVCFVGAIALSATNGGEVVSPAYLLTVVVLLAWAQPLRRDPQVVAVATVLAGLLLAGSANLVRPLVNVAKARADFVATGEPFTGGVDSPIYGDAWFVLSGNLEEGYERLEGSLIGNKLLLNAACYRSWLRAGIRLLRQWSEGPAVVTCFEFSNPFPYAMGWPSPRGELLYWHFDRNIHEASAPDPAVCLAEVEAILQPLEPIVPDSSARKATWCAAYLQEHFREHARDEWFILYVRRSGSTSPAEQP